MCSVSGCHGIHYGMCCLYDWIFTGVPCVVCLVVMVFIAVCAVCTIGSLQVFHV